VKNSSYISLELYNVSNLPQLIFPSCHIMRYLLVILVPKPVSPTPYFLVPRQRVKNFFGREEQLVQVASYFKEEGERPRIVVLHALGGQGKSQIALEYCQQARQQYRGVFWVNSSSPSTLTQALVSIAYEIHPAAMETLSDDDAKVAFTLQTLEQWKDRWLMVFDNYDDPATFSDVERFVPQGTLSTNTACINPNFVRRQRRYSLHQSSSRSWGIRSHYRCPANAR